MSSTKLLFLKVFLMKILLKNGKGSRPSTTLRVTARTDNPAVTLSVVEVLVDQFNSCVSLSHSSDKISVLIQPNQ